MFVFISCFIWFIYRINTFFGLGLVDRLLYLTFKYNISVFYVMSFDFEEFRSVVVNSWPGDHKTT